MVVRRAALAAAEGRGSTVEGAAEGAPQASGGTTARPAPTVAAPTEELTPGQTWTYTAPLSAPPLKGHQQGLKSGKEGGEHVPQTSEALASAWVLPRAVSTELLPLRAAGSKGRPCMMGSERCLPENSAQPSKQLLPVTANKAGLGLCNVAVHRGCT